MIPLSIDEAIPRELLPACYRLLHLFFGEEIDGRTERDRVVREAKARRQCFKCIYRHKCLRRAVMLGEEIGVWGGMGEGERRRFVAHLKNEGYDPADPPDEKEFLAALASFYRKELNDTSIKARDA